MILHVTKNSKSLSTIGAILLIKIKQGLFLIINFKMRKFDKNDLA